MRAIATFVLVLLSATAHAERRVEVGVSVGGHAFSDSSELGVADHAMEPGPVSSGLLGVRFGLPLGKRLAIEAEASWIPTEDDVLGDEVSVYGLGAHARIDLLTGRLRPFVVVGIGALVLRSASAQMDNDADQAFHWGLGLRYALRSAIDLRIDSRHLIVPGRTHNGATSDYQTTLGASYRFGSNKGPPKPLPPPPPPPRIVTPVVVPEPAPAPIVEPPKPILEELAGIGFERDSWKIDVYSAPILERAFSLLDENPSLSVEIAGHTSSEGDPDKNLMLSLARAEAVKTYLVRRGIAADRILTVGHGSEQPIADNRTETGRRQNRRIEFRVLSQPRNPSVQ
jgi:outer membrane protein OmpA-like peptidoglycan-associated protein